MLDTYISKFDNWSKRLRSRKLGTVPDMGFEAGGCLTGDDVDAAAGADGAALEGLGGNLRLEKTTHLHFHITLHEDERHSAFIYSEKPGGY